MKRKKSTPITQSFREWEKKFDKSLGSKENDSVKSDWERLLAKNCDQDALKVHLWMTLRQPPPQGDEYLRMKKIAKLSRQLRDALSEKWQPKQLNRFYEVLDLAGRALQKSAGHERDDFPAFFGYLHILAAIAGSFTGEAGPKKLRSDSRKRYFGFLSYVEERTGARNLPSAWNLLRLTFQAADQEPPDQDALDRGYSREKQVRRSKPTRLTTNIADLLRAAARGQ